MRYSRNVELVENIMSLDSVFGPIPSEGEIFIPDTPFAIRNNCQIGQFTLGGSQQLGNKLSLRAIKFSRFFGDLGQTQNESWGQLWFVAEPGKSGDIPENILCLTYVKTKSLSEFNNLVVQIQARHINPATGVFTCGFVKESRTIIGSDGQIMQGTYYSLGWSWTPAAEFKSAYTDSQLLAAIAKASSFHDLEGTASMVCLDRLSASERSAILVSRRGGEQNRAIAYLEESH